MSLHLDVWIRFDCEAVWLLLGLWLIVLCRSVGQLLLVGVSAFFELCPYVHRQLIGSLQVYLCM